MSTHRQRHLRTVQATQWYRNGDHPRDDLHPVTDSETGTVFMSEGLVVRYFRDPTVPSSSLCPDCGYIMHVHGWMDSGAEVRDGQSYMEHGRTVCPGSWIVLLSDGAMFPCPPGIFSRLYESAADHVVDPDVEGGAQLMELWAVRARTDVARRHPLFPTTPLREADETDVPYLRTGWRGIDESARMRGINAAIDREKYDAAGLLGDSPTPEIDEGTVEMDVPDQEEAKRVFDDLRAALGSDSTPTSPRVAESARMTARDDPKDT